ncbi:MAG TPA: acyl-CoA carboxylase subunit beta [bacterium]|nr:acyl-CoA carboxylase subunit beta [bacterium]
MGLKESFQELESKNRQALEGLDAAKIEKQHQAEKLTARERIDILLDRGSFVEIDRFSHHRARNFGMDQVKAPGDGVITGHGKIDGRTVFLFAQDFTQIGGSLGESHAKKICKVMDHALRVKAPMIGLNDSGGARIQEGIRSLAGYGDIFRRNVRSSGVIPQISAILGPCAGGAVYSPALTDFILMADKTSYMFVTGPDVVRSVMKTDVTKEQLGGAWTHFKVSGQAHLNMASDRDCLNAVRKLLGYLPSNNEQDPPFVATDDSADREEHALDSLIPAEPHKPYDMKTLLEAVVDTGSFFELQAAFAMNVIIAFARMGGQTVGIVANQPKFLAGCLDIHASAKAARFIRFCDAFNIPIVTFVDVPGFLPGTEQEAGGIIRTGAKLVYAYCEATVPKVAVVARKAYGGAYIVMSSQHVLGDVNFAYPTAEIAVMGPDAAVSVLHKKRIASAKDPEKEKSALTEEYRRVFADPFRAAEEGNVDEVILPRRTRSKIIQALTMLRDKVDRLPSKKHGNVPL